MNEIVPGKWPFASIKRQCCLTKGHLGNQEGHMEVEYPLHMKLFLTPLIQIKKKFFFKKGHLFNEVSDPWMLYLFEIVPACCQDTFMSRNENLPFISCANTPFISSLISSLQTYHLPLVQVWSFSQKVLKKLWWVPEIVSLIILN